MTGTQGWDPMAVIAIIGVTMLASSILAGFVAGYKNRDISHWMAVTFFLPPALLILMMMGKQVGPRPRRPSLDEQDRLNT